MKKAEPMSPLNVLLVDDEVNFIQALARRLAKRRFNVVTALSGEDALKLLEERPDIEIVVLDVRMPGLSGFETLAEIKRQFATIEVIILTGNASVESAIKTKRLGAFDYLIKPCNIDELTKKINEAANLIKDREKA